MICHRDRRPLGATLRRQQTCRGWRDGRQPDGPSAAWIGLDVELAPGVIVCAGAIVTTNVRLGRHTHLNVQVTVSHDCRIGEYVTVAPMTAISGNVTLEDEVELGAGVSIIPAVTIGRGSLIGAGAVVTRDIAPGMVAVGVPARSRPR